MENDADPAVDLPGLLARLHDLHTEVDRNAEILARRHGDRLHCAAGCSGCCIDGIRVFEIEAENLRHHHGELLEEGEPAPAGRCAFLSPGGLCRVYADRPYVCRTQGLPLRWIEETEAGQRVEKRDICPENEEGPPLPSLPAEDLWRIGPYEGRLASLQKALGGTGGRVSLRGLFRKASPGTHPGSPGSP
jgi:hypothetical protein